MAGEVENPDPWDLDTTLLKMAEKRAHVDATLRACAASGLFTQDIEDQVRPPAPVEPAPEPRRTLRDVVEAEAIEVAERIRTTVRNLQIEHPALGASEIITVSIGVAAISDGVGPGNAIEHADQQLFAAKKGGRDRVSA